MVLAIFRDGQSGGGCRPVPAIGKGLHDVVTEDVPRHEGAGVAQRSRLSTSFVKLVRKILPTC